MAIVHETAISYKSTIDTYLDLLYDISYDDTLTSKPLIVIMHGYSQDRTSVIAAGWKDRVVANCPAVVVVPDMRGRTTSEGKKDSNARELHDIIDAVNHAISNYSTYIDSTNINVLGYSGGGGNVFKLTCSYPDFFGVKASFFGISDYGYDDPDGWWYTTPAQRPNIEVQIDDTPANVPDDYYSRAAVFFLANSKYGRCRAYHDDQDTNTPPINTENVDTEVTALGLTNWAIDITGVADPVRWEHGLPVVGDSGEDNIQAEAAIFAEINAGTYKNPSIDNSDTLRIPGHLITKHFGVWLGIGTSDAGNVTYNLTTRTFTINNNDTTLNNVDVEFQYYNLDTNSLYNVEIDGSAQTLMTDGNGTLIYRQVVAGNGSLEIIIGTKRGIPGARRMAPQRYLNSVDTYYECRAGAAYVRVNDTNVVVMVNVNFVTAYRSDGLDIVVTLQNGTLVPRHIIANGDGTFILWYRDPTQNAATGGTQVYIQWGGSNVNVANDATVFDANFGGGMNHQIVVPGEDTAANLTDISGHYTATDTNLTYSQTGKIVDTFSMVAGSNVNWGNITQQSNTANFTIMGWLNLVNLATNGFSYRRDSAGTARIQLEMFNSFIYLRIDTGSYARVNAAPFMSSGTWIHLTYVYDGTLAAANRIKLYADGVPIVLTINGVIPATTGNHGANPFYMGFNAGNTTPGSWDEFRIFDGSLSENQNLFQYDNQNLFTTNGSLILTQKAFGTLVQSRVNLINGISI